MDTREKKQQVLQWHPAFFAGLQIELKGDAENLIFENEHQLGTKPKEIDVLIIKKEVAKPVRKNIGRIFRKYNIIEYKSPQDYLGVDDFYKVYAYACFYKSDAAGEDSIKIEEITISFVCNSYPEKLINHLREIGNYSIIETEKGIYYLYGDKMPMQLIVTKELSEENLWLKSLTNHLTGTETADNLLREYGHHKEDKLYKSVMDMIVRANKEKFVEVKTMCEALEELMKDELDAKEREGRRKGEEQVNSLIVKLSEAGRMEDIVRAAKDREYQKKLFAEFGI